MTHRHNKSLCLAILSDNSDVQALFLAKTTQTTSVRHASTCADDTWGIPHACVMLQLSTRFKREVHLINTCAMSDVATWCSSPWPQGPTRKCCSSNTSNKNKRIKHNARRGPTGVRGCRCSHSKNGHALPRPEKSRVFQFESSVARRHLSHLLNLFRETALEAASLHNALPFFFSAPTQTAFT
jgi:hypothetical protein